HQEARLETRVVHSGYPECPSSIIEGGTDGTNHAHSRCSGMSTKQKVATDPHRPSNLEKDPDEWTTGDEPMTGAQASYLKTLSEEAGEEFDPGLSKAEASKNASARCSRRPAGATPAHVHAKLGCYGLTASSMSVS